MKVSVTVIAIILMGTIICTSHQIADATSVANIERISYGVKRSLCNTFGGCGFKRSVRQRAPYFTEQREITSNDGLVPSSSSSLLASSSGRDSTSSQTRKNSNAVLMAEILGDLLEYLETNEKYQRGKYVVIVPSNQYDTFSANPSVENQLTVDRGDVQELQIG